MSRPILAAATAVSAVIFDSPLRDLSWRERLLVWVTSVQGAPFRWGENDCAMICFEAVDKIRGSAGVAARYRGIWSSGHAAIRYQRQNRLNLEAALMRDGVFRFPGPPTTGDLVLHPHPSLPFVCGHVCLGDVVLSANEESGVYLGQTAAALAQPGAFAMRIA